MLENLKRQEAVLPTIDRRQTLDMLMQLQTLYFGDDDAVTKYGNADYWNALAKGQLTCNTHNGCDEDDELSTNTTAAAIDIPLASLKSKSFVDQITTRGYHVLPSPPPKSKNITNHQSSAFTNTLKALKDAGWPPQFLLMYDETWDLLRDTVHQIIGYADDNDNNSNGNDWGNITIESDVNIWSLSKHKPPKSYIGGNFINPHRDMTYNACHDEDTEHPTSLSVWIPLNPSGATEYNGCMRCLPIENDDFFYSPQHPRHSNNSDYTDEDDGGAEKLIVEQFGCGIWDPSVVHWSGSYELDRCGGGKDEEEIEPRASLAFTIRLGLKAADFGTTSGGTTRITDAGNSTSDQTTTGPVACLVKDCGRNGGLKRRIQVVAKSLLSYSHHWPGFPYEGFAENLKRYRLPVGEEGGGDAADVVTKSRSSTTDNLNSLLQQKDARSIINDNENAHLCSLCGWSWIPFSL